MRYQKSFSAIRISDGRNDHVRTYTISGEPAALYEYCAEARTPSDIAARFGVESWVQSALQEFVDKNLTLHLDGRYLSLALPENPYFDLTPLADQPIAGMAQERSSRDTQVLIT